jgi:ribonuclease P protein component
VGSEAVKSLLASASIAKTAHFSLHAHPREPVVPHLPTDAAPDRTESVDNPTALMLVVPKRHAKRAVTRNLIKRQMRSVAEGGAAGLDAGALLIRLRAPFDRRQFPSAASAALRQAVRVELDALFERAARALPRAALAR